MASYHSPIETEFRKRSVIPTDYKVEEKALSRRATLVNNIAKILNVDPSKMIQKTKTVVPLYVYDMEPRIRRPDYDYYSMVMMASTSWPIRRTFNAIIKEATRNWGHIDARFKHLCIDCGRTYQQDVEKCDCGSGRLRKPRQNQRKKAIQITTATSRDRRFPEFVRTTMFYTLATDDNYWSLVFEAPSIVGKKRLATEVYNEHPGFIFPVGDRFGFLGAYEYFCPLCYNTPKFIGKDEPIVDIRDYVKMGQNPEKVIKCPECGEPMVQTSYVQEIGGQIVARFARNEIVHQSVSRLAPELFGTSRMATIIKLIKTIQAMDDYQLETATEGKVGGLLGFPGLDQERVGEILKSVKAERETISKRDIVTGNLESSKRTALIFVGLGEEGGNPIKVPFLDLAETELTLKFYQIYINAIDEIYGVQSMTEVVDLAGKKSSSQEIRTKIEVTKETAQANQKTFSDSFNDELLPLFGVTDWIWVWDKLEPKDLLRDADTRHQVAATAQTAVLAGFKVEWGEDDKLTISGTVDPEKEKEENRKLMEEQAKEQPGQSTQTDHKQKPTPNNGPGSHQGKPNKQPGVIPKHVREDHRGSPKVSERTNEVGTD